MDRRDVTVVLAHGAWADGSSWARVIERLRVRGQRAVAAPLPLTSLADDVAALERTVARTTGAVVLAGHAYGGAVIGAARADRVKALAFVAPVTPDEGEAPAEAAYRGEQHPLAPKLAPDADGLVWMPHEAFANAFAHQADAADQALLAAVQRPVAVAAISQPVGRPSWKDIPSWFLVAEQDRLVTPANQWLMAKRMGAHIAAHPVDHAPMVSHPELVTQFILDAVHA